MIIAAEMSSPLRLTCGPAITHAGDLAAILSGLNEGDVLFIDEIHRMSRPAEEMLYIAMEDFRVDVVIGKGPGATAIPLEIPPFTLVGATTRAGLLPGPLRDRFGFTGSPGVLRAGRARADRAPLGRAARRPAHRRGRRRDRARARAARPASPTGCCAGSATSPRSARTGSSPSTSPTARWTSTRSTSPASTGSTGPCSTCSAAASAGGRSGVSTLAVAVGEERETVEEVAEPFLVRLGLLARTPRGRVATAAAWQHLGPRGAPRAPVRARRRVSDACSTVDGTEGRVTFGNPTVTAVTLYLRPRLSAWRPSCPRPSEVHRFVKDYAGLSCSS